jgi:hypothetical protein
VQFETSLDDDLARSHVYEVDPVGAYSVNMLIGSADAVFAEDQRKNSLITEQALTDFRAAGRCLIFDLPTACAFHAFRATDAMLRGYCAHFNATPKGNSRDWGTFIRSLRDVITDPTAIKKPNPRTVELVDSIRVQDRNPLVHPELNLDSDGALLMFDLCKKRGQFNGDRYQELALVGRFGATIFENARSNAFANSALSISKI